MMTPQEVDVIEPGEVIVYYHNGPHFVIYVTDFFWKDKRYIVSRNADKDFVVGHINEYAVME